NIGAPTLRQPLKVFFISIRLFMTLIMATLRVEARAQRPFYTSTCQKMRRRKHRRCIGHHLIYEMRLVAYYIRLSTGAIADLAFHRK
ncbi:MAG: hypothetical protein ACK56F_16270, partial [bacterium]